jgi:indole-3-glycerol phosphate synthase
MPDFLDTLAMEVMRTLDKKYYDIMEKDAPRSKSLKEAIQNQGNSAIISELKFASPSEGAIREKNDIQGIVSDMEEGGAVGISILAEPRHFGGNIGFIPEIRNEVEIPLLMKDIILSPIQIDAASRVGADAVLLIQTIFDRGYCIKEVQEMIDHSHSTGLEVLLEAHTEEEFLSALQTNADMIGINNRDLKTLKIDLEVTKSILSEHSIKNEVIVSESGIQTPDDIRLLRGCGVKAFLVGTAIMKADNIKEKVKELAETI